MGEDASPFPEEEALFLGSSASGLLWLFFPDALTANLGHRGPLLDQAASEPVSPAGRGAHAAGGLRLGARKGPPAFELRARVSMAQRRRWVARPWVKVEFFQIAEERVQEEGGA